MALELEDAFAAGAASFSSFAVGAAFGMSSWSSSHSLASALAAALCAGGAKGGGCDGGSPTALDIGVGCVVSDTFHSG